MDVRLIGAEAIGAASTWALSHVFHRPAANFPGKVGLYADPHLIADLRSRLREGAIVVTGTNGKTTVTNLLADSFEAAGKTVACNRTGANLDSGVATALLHTKSADWGVLESDELWLAKILPQLKPRFVVLLNLFRDQLDRMGEIDHMQASIAGALASSPDTALIYNADDPLCQAVADRVGNLCIPFGIDEDLELAQNTVADASMCQRCDGILAYEWRQYGQLGSYICPNCGFGRQQLAYAASNVALSVQGASFTLQRKAEPKARFGTHYQESHQEDKGVSENEPGNASSAHQGDESRPFGEIRIEAPFSGAYMLYNMLAVYAAADCCGIPLSRVGEAIESFAPRNGRLQSYEIGGRRVLLNLAKNPTGFNQNLRIVMGEPGPKAVAFFINDKEADGHDVSWLWDIDFQELAAAEDLIAYAGGIRRNDMQVRLKYAGVPAELVDGAEDFFAKAVAVSPDASLFLIANYTALPHVKEELDRMQERGDELKGEPSNATSTHLQNNLLVRESVAENEAGSRSATRRQNAEESAELVIAHLYPELLNLYGDGGNVTVLAQRARWRGIQAQVMRISHGQELDLSRADIVFLGGGPDREQHLASLDLVAQAEELRRYVEDDGVLLAICGGYQILGREWLLGDESVPGLGIVDITTKRAEGGSHNRLVGNIALRSPLAGMPVIGYENHAGRTFLGSGCEPFGHVAGKHGKGNNDVDGADGVRYRNVVGTYLHGPLLAKNPEVADWLIERALARRAAAEGRPAPPLPPLDDACERAANDFMHTRLNVR